MAVAVVGIVNVDVKPGSIVGDTAQIGVAVAVLPFHVVMIQHRAGHRKQQGIQGHNYEWTYQLNHHMLRICACN